jgi:hypothetical protein
MLSTRYEDFLENRLVARGKLLLSNLLKGHSSSIQSISANRAEQIGSYRFLNNRSVTESILIEEQKQRCSILSKGKVVLCISDTTEANFYAHRNRLKPNSGLGFTAGATHSIGFMGHLCFVLDAKSYLPYGVSDLKLWHRAELQSKDEEAVYKLPIAQKESNKWLQGCRNSNETLKEAASVIHIQDREGDIYEQLMNFPQEDKAFYIIRSSQNRATDKAQKLYSLLEEAKVIGTYLLPLTGEGNSKSGKGIAIMEVKFITTKIKKPAKRYPLSTLSSYTEEITLLETKQTNAAPNSEPICWRILTSCKVTTLEDACQVIEWYTARWFIEELFKVIKKENFNIEASELESGWALRKLFILIIDTAIKLFQLYIVRDLDEGETIDTIASFSTEEFSCLEKIGISLEGKTEKQKNQHKKYSIHWSIWILARLGGWKGYQSQRKPGVTTIISGLNKFYNIYKGWQLQNTS